MNNSYIDEPMVGIYLFETNQLIEQLEQIIVHNEKSNEFSQEVVNEVFRIMHTIKGSSAMMLFDNIADLTHSIEEVFHLIREEKIANIDYNFMCDLILESIDFIKLELEKIKNSDSCDGDPSLLLEKINIYLSQLQGQDFISKKNQIKTKSNKKEQFYISKTKDEGPSNRNAFKVVIYFEEGCQMENVRSYTIIHNIRDISDEFYYLPEDIIDNDNSANTIREEGFTIYLTTDKNYHDVYKFFEATVFLSKLEVTEIQNHEEIKETIKSREKIYEEKQKELLINKKRTEDNEGYQNITSQSTNQTIISVNVDKLDKLMDLVGEMVVAEAMVTQNPDLRGLQLDNFQKASRQLKKITKELQEAVMSIRMVKLATTFHKMHRIVRDMCKKLDKEVSLKILGEETEVDKNIIEHISSPLMHLVRNAIDHGIESSSKRVSKGKLPQGTIVLEAKNAGSDVLIIVKDDGKGLDRDKVLDKAKEKGLISLEDGEMTDKEIYELIFHPGFSTNERVTEYSGRGVGMDVVVQNIAAIGGSVSVDSKKYEGTTITLKIPLTLAIIDGMNLKVGNSCYTIPIISIKQSFRPREKDIIIDPNGNEMIMVRGECYPLVRIHRLYGLETRVTNLSEGIIVMVEDGSKSMCIFADELLGQQQVVVKTLPNYIKSINNIKGLAGCTLLGDGSISLILDVAGLFKL